MSYEEETTNDPRLCSDIGAMKRSLYETCTLYQQRNHPHYTISRELTAVNRRAHLSASSLYLEWTELP